MTIPFEDGFMLLTKWSEAGSLLNVLVNAGDAASTVFSARITTLSDGSLWFSMFDDSGNRMSETIINLAFVTSWEYRDLREAPEPTRTKLRGLIASTLELRMQSTTQVVLCEIGDSA